MSKDVEEADLLLDSFVQFLSINAPLKKRGTVNRLIEEALKNCQVQFEERRIRLSKRYDRNLPETIVPDGQLSYILDSILRCGISAMTPGGDVELSAKSFKFRKDVGVHGRPLKGHKEFVRVDVLFKSSQKQGGPVAEAPFFEESLSVMLLRLLKELVRKNHGAMKVEKDEKQGRLSVSLWFPSEKRETPYYRPIGLSEN